MTTTTTTLSEEIGIKLTDGVVVVTSIVNGKELYELIIDGLWRDFSRDRGWIEDRARELCYVLHH